MAISHKKINEIKQKMDEVLDLENGKELLLSFIKETLNYNEDQGTYNKEHYEKYRKPYIEKNREKLNKQKADNARKRYHEKKLEKQQSKAKHSIEEDLEKIKINT